MIEDYTQKELDTIQIKYYDKLPLLIICSKLHKTFKFVINSSAKLVDLHSLIKKRLELSTYESLLFFVAGRMIGVDYTLISTVYALYKNKNGVLYIHSLVEQTFG